MRLIDADELKKAIDNMYEYAELSEVIIQIDNAPTVELTETVIQSVLNKRCMTAVSNEYLIALHNNRSTGEWEKPFEMNGKLYHKCNNCHVSSQLILIDKFCPNCGARMKGAEE